MFMCMAFFLLNDNRSELSAITIISLHKVNEMKLLMMVAVQWLNFDCADGKSLSVHVNLFAIKFFN